MEDETQAANDAEMHRVAGVLGRMAARALGAGATDCCVRLLSAADALVDGLTDRSIHEDGSTRRAER